MLDIVTNQIYNRISGTHNIKGGELMNMQEAARLILGLRAAGWTEKAINDFMLFIESGDEQYKPKADDKKDAKE